MESRYIHRTHNVSVLMYHIVCAAKYRRMVMSEQVDEVMREVCLEIEKRYEIWFLWTSRTRSRTGSKSLMLTNTK